MTVVASQSKAAPAAAEHRFFSTMSIVSAVAIVAGFSRTYAPRLMSGTPPVPAILHVHAAIFACWLLLFITQTLLVLRGQIARHKQVGTAGMVLAALMLVVGVMAAVSTARLGHKGIPGVEFPDAAGFLVLNLDVMVIFGVLVGAAWWYRRKPQVHKRLMLMATVGCLVPPGISRLPLASGNPPVIAALALLFLLAGPAYDLITRRRIHPAYVFGVVASFLGFPPIAAVLSTLPPWRSLAAQLIG